MFFRSACYYQYFGAVHVFWSHIRFSVVDNFSERNMSLRQPPSTTIFFHIGGYGCGCVEKYSGTCGLPMRHTSLKNYLLLINVCNS